MPLKITLLGNNSGRNLGDAAILSSILEQLKHRAPDATVYVPTIAPGWIDRHYGTQYSVQPINVMPWTGSIRLLGIPTLWAIARSDVALICDGIIFGKKILNPAFNYLITLLFLVPWARLCGCKMVCLSCGIGPFPSAFSRWCAQVVLKGCDLLTMRDQESIDLCRALGVTDEIPHTGDVAFINPVSTPERGAEILRAQGTDPSQPILGVNVTKYLDSWLPKDAQAQDKGKLIDELVNGLQEFVRRRKAQDEEVQLVLFSTQPMDEPLVRSVAARLKAPVVDNSQFLSHDIQAAMAHCRLFLGMRFHSLVLSSAVGVPVVGLIYAPKVRGLLADYGTAEYALSMQAMTAQSLADTLDKGWHDHAELKARQQRQVRIFAQGAHRAFEHLFSLLAPKAAVRDHEIGMRTAG